MRTRAPQAPGRALASEELNELRRLLVAVPVGACPKDAPLIAFVDAWYRAHIPARMGSFAIHYLRATESATAELLQQLRAALDDPDVRSVARPNCRCDRCSDLRA